MSKFTASRSHDYNLTNDDASKQVTMQVRGDNVSINVYKRNLDLGALSEEKVEALLAALPQIIRELQWGGNGGE